MHSSITETLTATVWSRLLSIQVLGQFNETLQCKDQSSQQTVFVVKGLKTNLLGLPAITALKLAAKIDAITDYQAIIE